METPEQLLQRDPKDFKEQLAELIFDNSNEYVRSTYAMEYLRWLISMYPNARSLETFHKYKKM